jgi:hypothetical protein
MGYKVISISDISSYDDIIDTYMISIDGTLAAVELSREGPMTQEELSQYFSDNHPLWVDPNLDLNETE